MEQIAGWLAPIATIVASLVVAANLGARITGWGFVVYLFGSVNWLALGLLTGQTSLVVANGFLFLTNIFGIWRWLGRQATYEDGSRAASEESAALPSDTLFSAKNLPGAAVRGSDGTTVATLVDAMIRDGAKDLAYVVASRGGVGGLGEELRILDPRRLVLTAEGVETDLTVEEFLAQPQVAPESWPAKKPARVS
jgi:PRC-barrel domain